MYGGNSGKAVHKKGGFGGKKMQRMLNFFLCEGYAHYTAIEKYCMLFMSLPIWPHNQTQ